MGDAVAHEPRQSGIVIRPMGIGELLDTGFALARNNFRLLITVAAWGVVPAQALSAIMALVLAGRGEISITASLSLASALGSVLSGFGGTLAAFALQITMSRLIEPTVSNVPLRPWPLYRAGIGRMLFWAVFMLLIVIVAIPLFIVFPLGIYLAVRWSMSFIPFVAQRMGPIASMRRSWALTSRAWWHTAAVLVVTGIVISVLQAAVGGVLALGGAVAGGVAGEGLSMFLSALAASVANLLFTPFSIAIYTVLYYELRARNEGFDLTQRAHQLLNASD
ncbi:MAG TPA: hypothetical protein VHX16_08915 [Chloroflexota bacterium]|jgi:hypothetical protein|nr:hypothetical protein [Chloroflexota bacterium]